MAHQGNMDHPAISAPGDRREILDTECMGDS